MNEISAIQYFSHEKIDKAKWDACIQQADNGLIYAYSFYLDAMADQWDALVFKDYEAVMPLTWRKKFGIYYLYQPFLIAQLGVFVRPDDRDGRGKNMNAELVEIFLKAIPKKFRYWDICLNHKNYFVIKDHNLYQRMNYVLDLNKPYEKIYESYSENIQRNIRKAQQAGCTIEKNFDVEKVIALAIDQMKDRSKETNENVRRFKTLYDQLSKDQKAITYGISLHNQMIASAVFFFSHNRAYYILVGNHSEGKNIGASHALIDSFIKDHAEKDLLLDFEGSDIPGLALFYKSFGAIEEKYAAIKLNRLPFYLKWIKK